MTEELKKDNQTAMSLEESQATNKSKKIIRSGGRNLIILGVVSTLIAMVTVGVSLYIYHQSGDIYLDRSRPGFLPDEDEVEDENIDEQEYDFSKTGTIDPTVLGEYLDKIQIEVGALDAEEKPFDANILADDSLGIPKMTETSE